MEKNFYNVLGVTETATGDDIRKAFKKMVLKYHPDKNKSPGAENQFQAVSEAYDVLGDKEKRLRYDKSHSPVQFKTKKTSQSFRISFSSQPNGYQFYNSNMNYNNVTYSFYNTNIHLVYNNQSTRQPPQQDSPVYYDLYVSLEDVLNGCTKKKKIEINVMNSDMKSSHREQKIFAINVKPGWKAGTKITFQQAGDQNPGSIPADIVFVVKDKVHNIFQRDGNDIRYICTISDKRALCGADIMIPTITGEKIPLNIKDAVRPDKRYRFIGHGLPFSSNNSRRGDLVVVFNIQSFKDSDRSGKDTFDEPSAKRQKHAS